MERNDGRDERSNDPELVVDLVREMRRRVATGYYDEGTLTGDAALAAVVDGVMGEIK